MADRPVIDFLDYNARGQLDIRWIHSADGSLDHRAPVAVEVSINDLVMAHWDGSNPLSVEIDQSDLKQFRAPILNVDVSYYFADPIESTDSDSSIYNITAPSPPKQDQQQQPGAGPLEPPLPDNSVHLTTEGEIGVGRSYRPVATTWGGARIDLFMPAMLTDQFTLGFGHKWADATRGFSGWEILHSARWSLENSMQLIAACSWGSERIDLFTLNGDGVLYHAWYDHGWKDWEELGTPFSGRSVFDLTATTRGPGLLDLFCISDGLVHHLAYDGRKWAWTSFGLPQYQFGRLDACALNGDRMDVLVSVNGLHFVTAYIGGVRQPWSELPLPGVPNPGHAVLVPRHLPEIRHEAEIGDFPYDIFVRQESPDPQNLTLHVRQVRGIWLFWAAAPPNAVHELTVVSPSPKRFDLFAQDGQLHVLHYWSNDDGQTFIGPETMN